MHAFIVTGGTKPHREELIRTTIKNRAINPHDVITIEPETSSISIDSLRAVAGQLSIRPFSSPGHAVIITSAHAMTIPAQHAFLKTLEEPSEGSLVFLETGQPDALIPTIHSRCALLRAKSQRQNETEGEQLHKTHRETLATLKNASIGEKIAMIDRIGASRESATAFVDAALSLLHRNPHEGNNAALLRRLLTAREQMRLNASPKLVLDRVFLP